MAPEGWWCETVLQETVARALAEDVGRGDLTTRLLVPPDHRSKGVLLFREAGVLAGMPVVKEVFRQLDPEVRSEVLVAEGDRVEAGQVVARLHGRSRSLLTGERVALNFLQRLSGTATLTAAYVEAVRGTGARILDLRKTTPGLRMLEKYAVRMGGGNNHRFALDDGILIKDNHLAAVGSVGEAIRRARAGAPHLLRIEVEVETLAQLGEALEAGADVILLDNMSLGQMREAVALTAGRALLEASGGITLDTVRAVAEAGISLISVGALTHSARAIDVSLELLGWHNRDER